MPIVVAVAFAGALGAAARYGLDVVFKRDPHHVPWVTLAINLSGSFVLGLLVAELDRHPHPALRPAITIGFLGAYTTFSTLSLETYRMLDRGHTMLGLTYAFGSVATGLAAVTAGVALGGLIA